MPSKYRSDASRAADRRYRRRLKEEMVAAYGGRCSCCGETTVEFLTLEHVGGGGTWERSVLKGGGYVVYRNLKKRGWPQEGYTVLCANCNQARGSYGVCPHALRVQHPQHEDAQ